MVIDAAIVVWGFLGVRIGSSAWSAHRPTGRKVAVGGESSRGCARGRPSEELQEVRR